MLAGYPNEVGGFATPSTTIASVRGQDLFLSSSADEGFSGGPVLRTDGSVVGLIWGNRGSFGVAMVSGLIKLYMDGNDVIWGSIPSLLWSNLVHAPQPADWNNCERPASDIPEFNVHDESVWLYYSFETGSNGRDGAVEWISPGGTLYRRNEFAIPAPATGCYRWFVAIHGDTTPMMSGLWEVRIVYDGNELGRRTFSILPRPGAQPLTKR
jgi:hypothetical protein